MSSDLTSTILSVAKYSTPILAILIVVDLVWISNDHDKSLVGISAKANAECPVSRPIALTVDNKSNRAISEIGAELRKNPAPNSTEVQRLTVLFEKRIPAQTSEFVCTGFNGSISISSLSTAELDVVKFDVKFE